MCWKHERVLGADDEASRISGLEGLRALFGKAIDKRNEHLWEPRYMDMIVPVFLHNMDEGVSPIAATATTAPSAHGDESSSAPVSAEALATENLRQLVSLASLGTLMSVLRPLFSYMDRFACWERPPVRQRVFGLVLEAVQVRVGEGDVYPPSTLRLPHAPHHYPPSPPSSLPPPRAAAAEGVPGRMPQRKHCAPHRHLGGWAETNTPARVPHVCCNHSHSRPCSDDAGV